ncbi:MAG: OmpA family protein [candidate division KSB1 bacterium]|nr:OmpA family protein [candidate division KSB1 bacterium]MDZ7274443.1 OmpA family protein [candidate division KSB1 bacterium]MDZ7284895.1 OmpA family protein [candidate division KSB1 bacterium]MDZ7297684.1 OmpA family protein [candidate division KSB1 bacterium]MDZ7305892.1 OmpA family protein [candidate division KSB1 bacterium]
MIALPKSRGGWLGLLLACASLQAQPLPRAPIDWTSYDYMPGHQVLFYDDFSGDRPGDPPAAWSMQPQNAKVRVLQISRQFWLHAQDRVTLAPLELKLPPQFTVEMDFNVTPQGYSGRYRLDFIGAAEDDWLSLALEPPSFFFSMSSGLTSEKNLDLTGGPHHLAVQVDGSSLKCYVDDERVLNLPKSSDFKASRLQLLLAGADEEDAGDDKCWFTNFTVAAGPAPFSNQLNSSGKIVAYGISFEAGKATILPRSTPTLKQLADLLRADATLNISIECHDNELESESDNVKLSQARAEALKDHLIAQYRIPEQQLSTKGWGETRPLSDVNTVESKKVNQRVEFIRK